MATKSRQENSQNEALQGKTINDRQRRTGTRLCDMREDFSKGSVAEVRTRGIVRTSKGVASYIFAAARTLSCMCANCLDAESRMPALAMEDR